MFEKKYSIPQNEKIIRPPSSGLREDITFPEGSPVREIFKKFLPKGEQISLSESFVVSRDTELEYTRFVKGEGANVEVEILLSNETNDILRDFGKIETKNEIKNEIRRIAADPYGDSSIDHYVDVPNEKHRAIYRSFRSVNAASLDIENKLGIPIAVKGSANLPLDHHKREDLIAQFVFMRQKEKEWQDIPEDIKQVLRICKVYAAVRYQVPDKRKYEEWLIMERVPDAKKVEDFRMDSNRFFKKVYGFSVEDHPFLVKIIKKELNLPEDSKEFQKLPINSKTSCYEWNILEDVLRKAGLNLSDLVGRNTLYTEIDPNKRQYILIDQRDRSKEY